MTLNQITVSVGGGHEMDRAGLSALIASLPGLRVVPLDMVPPPQVLVWEIDKRMDELPAVQSDTAILLLTDAAYESLPETVAGILSRDEPPTSLGIAVRQVARGEQYLSPTIALTILQNHQTNSRLTESQSSIIQLLTDREREIIELLAEGLSNKAIASRLYLSVRTVEGHLANIYSRLGVHSRTEAMLMAIKIPKTPGLDSGNFTQ